MFEVEDHARGDDIDDSEGKAGENEVSSPGKYVRVHTSDQAIRGSVEPGPRYYTKVKGRTFNATVHCLQEGER